MRIHHAFIDCQTIAELRQQFAAEAGELMRAFVTRLVAAGWSEHDARTANVRNLAHTRIDTNRAQSRASVLQYVKRRPEPITSCASQGTFDAPDEPLRSTFRHATLP